MPPQLRVIDCPLVTLETDGCARGRGAWAGRTRVSWPIRTPTHPMAVCGHHGRATGRGRAVCGAMPGPSMRHGVRRDLNRWCLEKIEKNTFRPAPSISPTYNPTPCLATKARISLRSLNL